VQENEQTRDELEELIDQLRAENARLREEIRRIQRDRHEVPPHYQ
jgi:septal ring factor EnvC (AmiA/AmiB activator)